MANNVKEKDEMYLLTSLSNALEVMDLLGKHDSLRAVDISNKLNINRSSIFKILYTLKRYKYIRKTSRGRYTLGLKFFVYGSLVKERINIRVFARPFLQKLRDKCNETVHLAILGEDLHVVFLLKESGNASIQMTSREGARMAFYLTALGKVLVAENMDHEMVERVKNYKLKRHTENTITDNDYLLEVLEETRDQGYGEDLEGNEEGLISYAAPIRDALGSTIAAVSISGPSYRMQKDKDSLIEMVKATAEEISRELGYDIL